MGDNKRDSERLELEDAALRQSIAALESGKDSLGAESFARWRILIDDAPMCIATVGLDKRFLTCNAAFCAFLGYSEEELKQKTISDVTLPEDVAIGMEDLGAIVAGKKKSSRVEKRYVRRDGTVIWGEVSINLVRNSQGQPLHFMPFILDITERKRAEELLRDSELKYRALFETAEGAILLFADGCWVDCNAKALSVFGCTREQIIGAHPNTFSPPTQPDGRPSEPETVNLITLAYTTGPQSFEWEHCRMDGTTFAAEVNLNRVDLGGKPHIQAIVRDVSEGKRAHTALELSSQRAQALLHLNQMTDATVREITDFALEEAVRLTQSTIGYLAFLNDDESVLTMHSWSKAAMAECAIIDKPIVYPVSTTGLWGEAVRQRRPVITNDYAATSPLKKGCPQGHVLVKRHMNIPVFDGTRIVIVAGVGNKSGEYEDADIQQLTLLMEGMWRLLERNRAEDALKVSQEQLHQSQKMEAVGQLAGGIAHDFNNLLTAILGYSDLILASGPSTVDEVRTDLEEIKRAGERASALTQQILAFSRRQTLRPRVVLLDEVIRGIEPLLRRTIGEDIDLHILELPGLAPVELDPHQFEQVVMNLVLNARDAMPSGGRLTVETANAELGEEFARIHASALPGSYVMLRVSDTGVGMDEDTKERIFEPFFTTKVPGAGTGLGLATVYGFVKQSSGSIFIDSEPGRGTSVDIYLPHAVRPEVSEESLVPPQDSVGGSETIMVVEDEMALQGLIGRILAGAGYQTLSFTSADEALAAFEQGEQVVDMLLTDVMLPGPIQGHDLARTVLALRPHLPVLYVSGYGREALVHAGRLDEGINLLEKPFTAESLTTMVREVLDRPRG
jgi:PAS domain S-box-containing protein